MTDQGEITEDVPEGSRWTIQKNTDDTYILKCGEYTLFHKEDGTPYLATSASDNKSSSSYYIDEQGRIYCTKKDGKYVYIKVDIDKNQGTRNATDYLVKNVDAKIYSISVGYDVSGDADVLGYMAEKGGGEKYVAYDTSQAIEAFRQIISNYYPSRVSLTDNLSQYAELYTDQLDFLITRESGGQKTTMELSQKSLGFNIKQVY